MASLGLTRNLPVKLLALLLALVVYAHVQTEKEQEVEMSLPLRLLGLPDALVLESGAPRHVSVRIRGTGKQILKLKVQPPEVRLDLAGSRPGVVQRMLSATDVALPVGTSAVVAEVVDPKMVEISVDTLVKRTIPVAPQWDGQPASALAVAGPLEVDPAEVTLIGPSRVLTSLVAVPTLPIDLREARPDVWTTVLLDLPPAARGVRSETVRIRVPLTEVSTRLYPSVPVVSVDLALGWVADLEPDSVELLVAGPPPLLEETSPESLRVFVSLADLEAGRHVLAPTVQLPDQPQLRLVRMRPSRLTVRLGPLGQGEGDPGN